jgi:hypothetical protein
MCGSKKTFIFCKAFSKPYNLIENYQILTFDNFIALKIKNAVRWFKCVKRNVVCSLLQSKRERRGGEDMSQPPQPLPPAFGLIYEDAIGQPR